MEEEEEVVVMLEKDVEQCAAQAQQPAPTEAHRWAAGSQRQRAVDGDWPVRWTWVLFGWVFVWVGTRFLR